MAQARFYASGAFPTTLAASIGATGNPQVNSITGLPPQRPFTVLIDWGLVTQEAISVTSAPTGSGPYTLPCTRGIDGTTAQAHSSGAIAVHGVTAQDFSQASVFIDDLTGGPAWSYFSPQMGATTASASGTLALNAVTQVTAASNLTMTLPSPVAGALIAVEREAASTGTVTVSGNIRGSAGTVSLVLPGESEMFLGTSSTWDPVAGHKTLGSLDSRYSTLREFPVALYAGADPTGATDSSAAVNAAYAAAVAAGGGVVSFGTGTWKFGTVSIPGVQLPRQYLGGNVHFRFAGPGATIITPNAANTPLFNVNTSSFPTAAGVRFMGGFTVLAHASGSTGPAIDLTGARQFVIESPSYFDSSKGASGSPGTYAQVIGFGPDTYACRITNPVCEGQKIGACFIGSINNATVVANNNVIENPLFEANTAPYMIDAAGTVQLTISGGIIEGNSTTAAIRLGWMTTVRETYFEQGGAPGVSFTMNAAGADNPGLGYDPGQCWLENNIHASNPDTLTIPAGVHGYTTLIFTPVFGSAFNIVDNTNTLAVLSGGALTLPPATTLLNNASGGTNGTTVTTGNSGSGSGNAFNAVVTGSGLTFDNTETVVPSSLSYKLVASASLPSLSWNVPATMSESAVMYLRTYAYFSGSVFDCTLLSSSGIAYALRVASGNWSLRATPGSSVTGPAVSANTWYRAELQFTPGNGTAVARIYSLSGTLLSTLSATGGTTTSVSAVYYGLLNSGTGTMWLASLGLSNAGWLGAAVPTDQLATDIQPPGVQAAGALGVPADAGHVHPLQALNYGGVFGDGSDVAATLDGTATVAWASKSGSTYTMTRDCFCTSLTISSGVTLSLVNSYRIFCQGTLSNAGTISSNGGSASGTGTGAGVGAAALAGSASGGASATGNGGNGVGTSGTGYSMIGVGTAGAGGAGASGTAGAGGGINLASTSPLRMPPVLLTGMISYFAGSKVLSGGPGGGAGGGDGTNKGGGGGGGGGIIGIAAHAAVNTGTISAAGGAGGTPVTGNCGGGGGGGGGLILVLTLTAWTAGTTAVTGGALGTAVGTGSNGTAGGSGSVLNVVVQ